MHIVKDRLGHSDIQATLNIYTHVIKTERREAAELFSDFIDSQSL